MTITMSEDQAWGLTGGLEMGDWGGLCVHINERQQKQAKTQRNIQLVSNKYNKNSHLYKCNASQMYVLKSFFLL